MPRAKKPPRRGRPPGKDPAALRYQTMLGIPCTHAAKDRYNKLAKARGVSLSELVRGLLDREFAKEARKKPAGN